MADEITGANPEAGTPAPEPTAQPQAEPVAAPEGTPAQETPEGTPAPEDRKATTEQFFQTKYQDTVAKLSQYEQQYGPLEQQPEPDPPPPAPEPEPMDDENEAWVNEVAKRASTMTTKQIQRWFEKQQRQAFEQQQKQQELAYADRELGNWAQTNNVPHDVLNRHIQEVLRDIPKARPTTQAKYVMRNIISEAQATGHNEQLTQQQLDAASKAKQLAGVEQPESGAPPKPASEPGKTWEQGEADNIAPDQKYVYPGD